MEITCGYATFFSEIGQLVSHLDCLVGFAVAAVTAPIPYSKPKIVDTVGTIKLVEARHPCLELLDNINFIPNSIDFDKVIYIPYFLVTSLAVIHLPLIFEHSCIYYLCLR